MLGEYESGNNALLDGVIKFKCRWRNCDCVSADMILPFAEIRRRLRKEGLIGVGTDGIGYGNISVRCLVPACQGDALEQQAGFLITGTQTSHISDLPTAGYSFVLEWSTAGNWVECAGKIRASSESLTHAAIYETSHRIQAVIHVHSAKLLNGWKNPA